MDKNMSYPKFTFECPNCGYYRVPCDFSGCGEEALYDGWYGEGLIRKMNACRIHVRLLRGYDEFKKELTESGDNV